MENLGYMDGGSNRRLTRGLTDARRALVRIPKRAVWRLGGPRPGVLRVFSQQRYHFGLARGVSSDTLLRNEDGRITGWKMSAKQEFLFRKMDPARYGEHRQKRPLFVQAYLKDKSRDHRLQDDRCKKAHEILLKWADLESRGVLQTQKESNVEAEFLTQVFGEALGYTCLLYTSPSPRD